MADSELMQKLAKRQAAISESENEMPANGALKSDPTPDAAASSAIPVTANVSEMADNELKQRLNRRIEINDGKDVEANPVKVVKSIYAEFHEFSRKQIKQFEEMFKKFDTNKDGFLCFDELKFMMEKLGAPQTHLALKQMIAEIDEDKDHKINLREFILIFRKAAAGELSVDSGLSALAQLSEIDVHEAGVGVAKEFFEAKIDQLAKSNSFEAEIVAEREERKQNEAERKERRQAFQAKQAIFTSQS